MINYNCIVKCFHVSVLVLVNAFNSSTWSGMCPGSGEWWLHKEVLNLQNFVIFNKYAQTVSRIPCRHFKVASKNKHFIYADILVLVVILSEWWLFYHSGGRGRPLPTAVGTSLLGT